MKEDFRYYVQRYDYGWAGKLKWHTYEKTNDLEHARSKLKLGNDFRILDRQEKKYIYQ